MQVSSVTEGWLIGLDEVVIEHHHSLNRCALAEASLESVPSCPNRFHDSGIRYSLSAPLGGGRTGGCQTSPYCEGFCGGRSEPAAADRDRHGLRHVVWCRGRARNFCHVCQGRVTRRRRRSLWVEPLLGPGWLVLCPPFLSPQSPDRRRLLSSAVQPCRRGPLCRMHRRVLSRMGGCAVQSVRTRSERGDGRGGESARRNGDRRGDRPGLYDLRWHVLRCHSGLCPDFRDHWGA